VVKETYQNHQYRFTFPGRAVAEDSIRLLLDKMDSFNARYIVASGSLPPGVSETLYGMIVDKANAMGSKCIVDTSGAALLALQNKKAFLIKPNRSELCKLIGIEKIAHDAVPEAAGKVIDKGFAEWVAVSMGAEGAWLISKTEAFFCKAPKVDRKSTVGAGDSMVAGITYMFSKGASPEEAIRFGVCCGSAATMNEGTQLFKKEDVYALYSAKK
jgi:6-phosphofructokinase 2